MSITLRVTRQRNTVVWIEWLALWLVGQYVVDRKVLRNDFPQCFPPPTQRTFLVLQLLRKQADLLCVFWPNCLRVENVFYGLGLGDVVP